MGGMRGESPALAAYEAFASAYDAFTSRNDYELFLSQALPELRRCGLAEVGRLLDVGCGSGNSFLPMLARGWSVVGCDISPAMIEIAREKAGPDVPLHVIDMRELPVFGEFELVWAIDDAVNYLVEDGDLEAAVAAMGANLAPGGLLVFDVNTLATYRGGFSAREVSERGGVRVVWDGLAATDMEPGSVCEARLEGDGFETHLHRQRHHPEAAVHAAIEAAGLRLANAFGYDDEMNIFHPPDELANSKIAYVAAK